MVVQPDTKLQLLSIVCKLQLNYSSLGKDGQGKDLPITQDINPLQCQKVKFQ